MQVKLNEVIDGIVMTSIEKQFYYYIPEEIIIEDIEELDFKDCIALPTNKEKDDYGTMLSFIEEKTDGEGKEWLLETIKGAGAFRRFKLTCERFNLLDDWYDYQNNAHEQLAINWCEYHGIEYLSDTPFIKEEINEEEKIIVPETNNYRLIKIKDDNVYGLGYLLVSFRKYLAKLKDNEIDYDIDDAIEELKTYLKLDYQIYAVSLKGKNIAFAIYKIFDNVVWLEYLYVLKEYRLKGVGKMLLEKGEEIANEYHNDTLYMYVHPNNDLMLDFLKKNNYDVLNLIEIRKKYPEENLKTTYKIGNHEYKY